MGEGMLMKRGILTLDFWKDTITYQKRIMPTGSLACAALNISDDAIENLITISRKLESFGKMLALGTKIDNAMLTSSKNTAVRVLEALRTLPPFDLLDMDWRRWNGFSAAQGSRNSKHTLRLWCVLRPKMNC